MTCARSIRNLVASLALLATSPASAQFLQQGDQIAVTVLSTPAQFGASAALSADGNTALIGALDDNHRTGAAVVFVRGANGWQQQGGKLVGSGIAGTIGAAQGISVALSADGNTAAVGGAWDNANHGAVWIFVRADGVWYQQGGKLALTDSTAKDYFGDRVALSADGNTLIAGAPGVFGSSGGGAYVFTRSNGVWSRQEGKLFGSGADGNAYQANVALSADGNTAAIGGRYDHQSYGAVWVFTRTGGVWSQQGTKLAGSGGSPNGGQGFAVSLSEDGNTLLEGADADDSGKGAAWVFVRKDGQWSQQGDKLVGPVNSVTYMGISVALSGDGNTALIGREDQTQGPNPPPHTGGFWVFKRMENGWSEQGGKISAANSSGQSSQGRAVAISADSSTMVIGAPGGPTVVGTAWVFAQAKFTGLMTWVGDRSKPERPGVFTLVRPGQPDIPLLQCGYVPPAIFAQHLNQIVTLTGQMMPPDKGAGLCTAGLYVPRF